jgi:hypothetical protein
LVATAVAEVGELAVVGTTPVVVLGAASSASAAATAATATCSTATATAASSSSSSSGTSAEAGSGTASAEIATGGGAYAEAAVDGAGAEAAESEAVIGSHSGGQAEGVAGAVGQCADERRPAGSSWATAASTATVGELLAAGFVVAGCTEASAGAAVDEEGFFGVGSFNRCGGSGFGGGDGLFAVGSGSDGGVLEAGATGWGNAGGGSSGRSALTTAAAASAATELSAVGSLRGGCPGGSLGGGDTGGFETVCELGHFQGPVLLEREETGGHVVRGGGKFEHFDLDVPVAGR